RRPPVAVARDAGQRVADGDVESGLEHRADPGIGRRADFRASFPRPGVDPAGGHPMTRKHLAPCAALALLLGCDAGPEPDVAAVPEAAAAASVSVTSVTRERVAGDVFHYSFIVRLGAEPNAQIAIHRVVRERAPWLPRPTAGAVMMLHGDFSTFATNFAPTLGSPASAAPGLAPFLAGRNIDVWGFDRRWTQAPAEGADLSDFGGMTVAQEIGDTRTALAFARAVRLVTSASIDRLVLVGFSH